MHKSVLLILVSFAINIFSQIPTDSLVAYYPFNGTPNDTSGNGNNGIIYGGVTWGTDRFDSSGKSAVFNGEDAFIEVLNNTTLNPDSQLTLSAWVMINDTNKISQNMLSKGWDLTPGYYGLGYNRPVYLYNYPGFQGHLNIDYPYNNNIIIIGAYPRQDQWYYLTLVYDGNNLISYLNGEEIERRNVSGMLAENDLALHIGKHNCPYPSFEYYFHGQMDDIRIYNRALTETEIQELYHEDGWPLNQTLNTIIITHGATFTDLLQPITESQWQHYVWQFAMADAVSENRDIYLIRKGQVHKMIADYEDFQSITQSQYDHPIEDIIGQYGTSEFTIDQNKDNVFIFDWTLESGVGGYGYSEAAADVLASILVELANEYPFILNNIHFIGHSRGTVVNSEAIQRLIFWASNNLLPSQIELDQNIHMTTLDAHAAGDNWVSWLKGMEDNKVNSSNIRFLNKRTGITGWKNTTYKVGFIDNYYQLIDDWLHGRTALAGLDTTNSLANINVGTRFSTNNDAHQVVHSWYHGTADTTRAFDNFGFGVEIERQTWYPQGEVEGFFFSRNRLGNLSQISSVENELINVMDDWTYGTQEFVFNSDFSKSSRDSIPGWSFQNGKSSKLTWTGGNISASLSQSSRVLIHNLHFIPNNAEYVWFRTRTIFSSSDVLVKVFISGQFITSFQLNNAFSNFVWKKFTIPSSLVGHSNIIRFELTSNVLPVTKVLLDDVGFWATRRIRSNVACPVDFHIYDNLGNHTGPTSDTTFVEEIPGSEYYTYEDSVGDKIKTVYLEPLEGNSTYTFKIESRDTTAYFNYEIEDYSDTTQGTVTYVFEDVAIEPNTVATCSLDVNTQTPALEVDIDGDGEIDSIYNPIIITGVGIDDELDNVLPTEFSLFQNYPNPFNPSTVIDYRLPVAGKITLKVYDLLGNEVETLVDEYKEAGNYDTEFNASKLSSGVYFYQLRAGDFIETKKMILLK